MRGQTFLLMALGCAMVVAASGCGAREEHRVPVRGRVQVAGQPLTLGTIGFHPDLAKGNLRGQASLGIIQSDGKFELQTAGKQGVAPGWYKVLIWATKDPSAGGNPWGPDGKVRKIDWLTHEKYTSAEATDLAVEVIDNPAAGRYDFELSR